MGPGNHGSCAPMLDQRLSIIEMTQTDDPVVVGCSGQSSLPMLILSLLIMSRYVIVGRQMVIKASVEEEPQHHSVLQLENSLKNTGMTQMVDLAGA